MGQIRGRMNDGDLKKFLDQIAGKQTKFTKVNVFKLLVLFKKLFSMIEEGQRLILMMKNLWVKRRREMNLPQTMIN
jgi:hypothetical protein